MKYFWGVDLGGTRIKIIDDNGRSLIENLTHRGENVFENIFKNINTPPHETVIGLAMPGEFKNGILNCRRFGLFDYDYKKPFVEKGYQVIPVNDAQGAGLGEVHYGAGKIYQDFIIMNLGTGIGGAIVMNGNLLQSSRGLTVGIISHVTVDINGPPCRCGRRGCLEKYADSATMLTKAKKAGIQIKNIKELANLAKHNEIAKNIFNETGFYLAQALAIVVDMLAPEAVIIGGGISQADNLIIDPIKKNLLPMVREGRSLTIEKSSLTDLAGAYGALHLAKQN